MTPPEDALRSVQPGSRVVAEEIVECRSTRIRQRDTGKLSSGRPEKQTARRPPSAYVPAVRSAPTRPAWNHEPPAASAPPLRPPSQPIREQRLGRRSKTAPNWSAPPMATPGTSSRRPGTSALGPTARARHLAPASPPTGPEAAVAARWLRGRPCGSETTVPGCSSAGAVTVRRATPARPA